MLVKRCDRCGAYYQNYSVLKGKRVPNAVRTINRDETNDGVMGYKTYDLCPECIHCRLRPAVLVDPGRQRRPG